MLAFVIVTNGIMLELSSLTRPITTDGTQDPHVGQAGTLKDEKAMVA